MPSHTRALGGLDRLVVALFAVSGGLLVGCDGGKTEPDAGTSADAGDGKGCRIAFSFRPTTTATAVYVAGEWDGFNRLAHPMTDDGSGTFSVALKVPVGEWGYLFLANGEEFLDPNNANKVTRDGKTYSLMGDCSGPKLKPEVATAKATRPSAGQGAFSQSLTLTKGADPETAVTVEGLLRSPDDLSWPETWKPLPSGAVTVDGDKATVSLSGLADGKYTLRLWPVQAGAKGPEVRLPFWIEAAPFDWRDTPMYMLMIDRFRDGDPTNNPPATSGVVASGAFFGGDLQGIEKAMKDGWFDKMGVKAIWMTPWQTQPVSSMPDDSGQYQVLGYHGYWPIKAREVDGRFGGNAALASMIREAHRHGIRVVMDTVLNHVHRDHEYFKAHPDWFRTGCNCGSNGCGWDDTPARFYCLFNQGMPDINWTVPAAAEQFTSDVLWWLDTFDVDGLRVDAAKHIEVEGVAKVGTAVRARYETAGTKYYMYGESYTGNETFLKEYVGPDKLDGQLNFPLWFAVPEPVFGNDSKGLQTAKDTTDWALSTYGDWMVNFVGSHDSARFITKADEATRSKQGNKWTDLPGQPTDQRAYDRLWLAMVNLMTLPGSPLLYYGDEYGEYGGSDPDNRHMMLFEDKMNGQQKAQLAKMRKLLTARWTIKGLGTGALHEMWCNDEPWGESKGNLWAYARPYAKDLKQSAVVVINLKYESWTGVKVDFPSGLGWTSGTVVDALTDREWSFTNSSVTVDVDGRSGVVLRLK